MKTFLAARDLNPFQFVKEIQARVSLILPAGCIKEEDAVEGVDKRTSRYVLVWYTTCATKEKISVEKELTTIAKQVLEGETTIDWEISRVKRSADTSQIMVKVTQAETQAKQADVATTPVVTVLALGIEESSYHLKTTDLGKTFFVVRGIAQGNGTIVEKDLPSLPVAFGKLIKHAMADLALLGSTNSPKFTPAALDKEFIESLCQWFANSPVVTKEALKHLTTFVELLTKREFTPE